MAGSSGDELRPTLPLVAGLDLRSLLAEVSERVESVALLADRLQALLQAVVSIGSQLDLAGVLHRIAETAAELPDARYAALGVVYPGRPTRLSHLVTLRHDARHPEPFEHRPR